jgi:hypothetical protein
MAKSFLKGLARFLKRSTSIDMYNTVPYTRTYLCYTRSIILLNMLTTLSSFFALMRIRDSLDSLNRLNCSVM